MNVRHALALAILFIAHRSALAQSPTHSPELAARADSLAALDPAHEFRLALQRHDLRFVAVCGYACFPPLDTATAPWSDLDLTNRVTVPGTSDEIANDDVARLNSVAHAYALRYNRLLVAYLRQHRRP